MSQVIALITGLALRTLRSAGLQAAYVAQPSLPPVRKTERKRQLRRQRQLARDIRGDIAEELNQLGTKSSWMQTANAAEAFGGVGYTIGDEGDEGVVDAVAGDDKEVERPAPGRETLEAQGKRLAADIARAEKQLGAMLGALVADEVPGAVRQRALSLVNWLSQAEADLAALRREWLSLEASTCTTGSRRVNLDADRSATLGADFGCYLGTESAQEELEELLAGLAADRGAADLSAGGHFEAEENGSDLDDSAPRKLVSSTRPDAPARPKVSVEIDELPRGRSRLTSALAAAASAQSASISSPLCTGKATLAQRSNARQQAFTHPTIGPRQQTTREMWRNWRDEISRAVDQMPDALRAKLTRAAKDAKQSVRAALKAHVLANLVTSAARAANPAEWRITPTMAANYRFREPGELHAHIRRIAVQREARTQRWLSAIGRARGAKQLRRFVKRFERENAEAYQASVGRLDRTLAQYTAGQMMSLRAAVEARRENEGWR